VRWPKVKWPRGTGPSKPNSPIVSDDIFERTVKRRQTPGRDGGTSEQIFERRNGEMNSREHIVRAPDGSVVHRHRDYLGRYGGRRQFPDEWTGIDTLNDDGFVPSGPR
jgi:hypothetical protein